MEYKYVVDKSDEKMNILGEHGWEIINKQPLLIGKPVHIDPNGELANFTARFFNRFLSDKNTRKTLKRRGYKIERIYNDEKNAYVYQMAREGRFLEWRLEFNYNESEKPDLYLTFGDFDMGTPAFINKSLIDSATDAKDAVDFGSSKGVFSEVEAKNIEEESKDA